MHPQSTPKSTVFAAHAPRPSRASNPSYLYHAPQLSARPAGVVSEKLSDDQVRAVLAAADFALPETPLNRFVTVDWERAGVGAAAAATRSFLKHASDFCRSNGSPFAYCWTLEGSGSVGVHAHILMHLDHRFGARFGHLQRGWAKTAGAHIARGDLKTIHVGGGRTAYLARDRDGGAFAEHQRRTVDYILKECSFEAARAHKLAYQPRSGVVVGQRSGYSHNLGPKARAMASDLVLKEAIPANCLQGSNGPTRLEMEARTGRSLAVIGAKNWGYRGFRQRISVVFYPESPETTISGMICRSGVHRLKK